MGLKKKSQAKEELGWKSDRSGYRWETAYSAQFQKGFNLYEQCASFT